MRFKIDWASLIVGRKATVFALFYFVYKGCAYIWRSDLTEGLLRYEFGGGGGGPFNRNITVLTSNLLSGDTSV